MFLFEIKGITPVEKTSAVDTALCFDDLVDNKQHLSASGRRIVLFGFSSMDGHQ